MPYAEDILDICTSKLTDILSKYSRGRFKAEDTITIKDIAANSFGIKITRHVCAFEIKQIINQIIFLEEQLKDINQEIKSIYSDLDSHLLTVPGIGENLAPVILADISDINNSDKPSKLIAYAGIDPSENQSGKKNSSNESMSKRGSPHLRRAIYTASLVTISNIPKLRE